MTRQICACILSGLLASLPAFGGEPSAKALVNDATPTAQKSGWEWYVSLPTWAAGLNGNVGVGGFQPITVDVAFKDILRNLDMTGALTVEARHNEWGIMADGLYLKMSAGGETPGRLLSSADLQVEQVLAELAVTYRLVESDRGYLDLIAGARYVYVRNELGFDLDPAGVREVSEDLSEAAVDRAVNVIRKEVSNAAKRASAQLAALNLDDRADALRSEVRDRAVEKILAETTLREIIQTIRALTPVERAAIRKKVGNSKEVLAANKALAQTVIQERVASTVSAAQKQAQRAVARARKQLANAIESAIRRSVPEQVAASKGWVDPFLGLRGRYNVSDKVYVAARADVGGFGMASDISWNVCGAIGCQLNDRWSTELGWRHLSIDYQDAGFVFDAEMSGLFLGLTYRL